MHKLIIAGGLVVAATSAALVPGHGNNVSYSLVYDQGSGARVILINAPGGAYIQCDPNNKSSPVRCNADGW
jgi:hypothetical protein